MADGRTAKSVDLEEHKMVEQFPAPGVRFSVLCAKMAGSTAVLTANAFL